jgi:NSS family neurotransmitter:Na+ symporter
MANASREQWTSRLGFIAAAVGSAVGLGNMWRFSYLTAEKGGAAFVALYLVFTAVIGLPIMLAELTIGRGSGKSPIEALGHYGGAKWRWLGVIFVLAGFIILSYYGVIAGWTVRYALEAIFVGFPADPAAHFGAISEGWTAFGFHIVFMAATMVIVMRGVTKGIERVAMIAMPVLFVLVCGIALYAFTLEGSGEGYRYYLNADFSNVLDIDVVTAAASHSFFSLSLGMGAILTFASYLPRDSDLPRESVLIAGVDFGVAFLAGLMVFPLIFALGLSDGIAESTIGALFVALPKAFAEMGGMGRFVGFCFFMTLVVGAITSAISLLEVVVASAVDGLGWSRKRAVLVMGGIITLLGGLSAARIEVLDVMEVEVGTDGVRWFFAWRTLLRFVVPAVLLFVLYHSVPTTLANVWGLFTGG